MAIKTKTVTLVPAVEYQDALEVELLGEQVQFIDPEQGVVMTLNLDDLTELVDQLNEQFAAKQQRK